MRVWHKSISFLQILRSFSTTPSSYYTPYGYVHKNKALTFWSISHLIPFKMRQEFIKFLGDLLDENLSLKEHVSIWRTKGEKFNTT